MDTKALAAALAPIVREAIARETAPLLKRIEELEAGTLEAARLLVEDFDKVRGEVGLVAKTAGERLDEVAENLRVEMDARIRQGAEPLLERLKAAEDALPGIGEEITKAAEAAAEATKALAREAATAAGELEQRCLAASAKLVEEMFETIEKPKDGKDADVEQVTAAARAVAAEEVAALAEKAVPAMADTLSARVRLELPGLLDGARQELKAIVDQAGPKIADEARAAIKSAAEDIPKPQDGEPGRDAAQIEVLPTIDEAKSYPRNTWAKDRGGLWRSFETTFARRGWECIVEGLAGVEIAYDDDMRKCTVRQLMSSGEIVEKVFHLPTMIHRGVWREKDYTPGDTVQKDGHMWIATGFPAGVDEPGTSPMWELVVRRGRDGKSDIRAAALSPARLGS